MHRLQAQWPVIVALALAVASRVFVASHPVPNYPENGQRSTYSHSSSGRAERPFWTQFPREFDKTQQEELWRDSHSPVRVSKPRIPGHGSNIDGNSVGSGHYRESASYSRDSNFHVRSISEPSNTSADHKENWWDSVKNWLGLGKKLTSGAVDATGGRPSESKNQDDNPNGRFPGGTGEEQENVYNMSSDRQQGSISSSQEDEHARPERISKFEKDIDRALEDLEDDNGNNEEGDNGAELEGRSIEGESKHHGHENTPHRTSHETENSNGPPSVESSRQIHQSESSVVDGSSTRENIGHDRHATTQAADLSDQEIASMVRAFHWLFRALDRYMSDATAGYSERDTLQHAPPHGDSRYTSSMFERNRDPHYRGELHDHGIEGGEFGLGASERDHDREDDNDELEADQYIRNQYRQRRDRRDRRGEPKYDAEPGLYSNEHRLSHHDRYRGQPDWEPGPYHPVSSSSARKPLTTHQSMLRATPRWDSFYSFARDLFQNLRIPPVVFA